MARLSKQFPYPFFANNVEDYKDNAFKLDAINLSTEEEFNYHFEVNITNEFILDLIKKEMAKLILIVESHDCIYKKVFNHRIDELGKIVFDVVEPNERLSGKIEIQSLLVAADVITLTDAELSDDFAGMEVSVEKNSIIGQSEGLTAFSDHSNVSEPISIFRIVADKNYDPSKPMFKFEYSTDNFIRILVSEEVAKTQKAIQMFKPLINFQKSYLLVPTLEALFAEFPSMKEMEDEHLGKTWFQAISKKFEKVYGYPISEYDEQDPRPTYSEVAQRLLDYPTFAAIKDLYALAKNQGGK